MYMHRDRIWVLGNIPMQGSSLVDHCVMEHSSPLLSKTAIHAGAIEKEKGKGRREGGRKEEGWSHQLHTASFTP